jgi:uncharacterized protein (TIGR02452 family)
MLTMSFRGNNRAWREDVFLDTQRRASHYPFSPSVKVVYEPHFTPRATGAHNAEITVMNADSIDAGKALKDAGYNPLVLNFANDIWAGGGVGSGAGAQEESLWRRTNLCETQLQDFYPLRLSPPEGVYTPAATVFKSKESEGCDLLPHPYQLSFVAVPAIRNPVLTEAGMFTPCDELVFCRKVDLVFQTAIRFGHDALVLGAFGCGAWNNPPAQVAEIFKMACYKYKGFFKKIVFACYQVEGTSAGYRAASISNLEIFSRVLAFTRIF